MKTISLNPYRMPKVILVAMASSLLLCVTSALAQVSLTTLTTNQNFDVMGTTGTTTPTGWFVGTGTTAAGTTVVAGTGSSTAGGNYNFGVAGVNPATDRALGSQASSSTIRNTEVRFVNNLGAPITSITISYSGEQWRVGGSASVANTLTMNYSADGTTFTPMGSSYNFISPIISAASGSALDGNASANRITGIGGTYTPASPIPSGATFYFRWTDPDDASSDNAIAVDDFTMTVTLAPTLPPVITGVSPSSTTANAGTTTSFTATTSLSDGAPDRFYWYKELNLSTNLIPTAATATLTLTNLTGLDTASYQVVASNSYGMSTSAVVTLAVVDPYLVSQPANAIGLLGGSAQFSVNVAGTTPVYRWYSGTPPSGTLLTDGVKFSGTTTPTLSIGSLAYVDANSFYCIATNIYGSVTNEPATLTVTNTGVLAYWDFNAPSINGTTPAAAAASAATAAGLANLNPTNGFIPANGGGSALDPINSVLGATNYYWGTSTYPLANQSNKTAGVFFKVATTGMKNINVSFDTRPTTSTSKYQRLQYTINGTDYIDYPVSSQFANVDSSTWGHQRTFSLVGFSGVNNNANFGVRIVTEFESTATYGASANANYVGVTNTYSSSGTLSYDIVTFTADAITNANIAPTLTTPAGQSVSDGSTLAVGITVGDADGNPNDLIVTATSPQTGLNLSTSGTGTSRFVNTSPSLGNTAIVNAPIIVTVTDINGDSATTSFLLTVNPLDNAPVISGLTNTNVFINRGTLVLSYTASDDLTSGDALIYAVTSANTNLLPAASIITGGSGTNRTLTLNLPAGQLGVAPLSLTVTDNASHSTTTNITVMVRPNTNVVFNEYFDYADGSLFVNSLGLWKISSGTGDLLVSSNSAVVNFNSGQDLYADLSGQPYTTNSGAVIYYSLKANFSVLPSASGAYFANLLDKNSLGSGPQTAFGARLWASTLNATTDKFRLGVGNGSGTTNTSGQVEVDLSTNTTYFVVVRFVPTNGLATIWLNPTYETDSSVTATDVPTPNTVSNNINITSFQLRQNAGEGFIAVDDVRVGLTFDSVVDNLKISLAGTNAILTWQNPQFSLQSTTNLTLPFVNVSGASSPYTNFNIATNPAKFFRTAH